jgi:hypothetical protein
VDSGEGSALEPLTATGQEDVWSSVTKREKVYTVGENRKLVVQPVASKLTEVFRTGSVFV